MIDISKGRYWDEGIQLVDGCTPCSPGCDHCWSLAMEKRFNGNHKTIGRGIWLHPDRLKRFNTRKSKVFAIWNDLHHESVPLQFRGDAYSWMLGMDHNTYLILTKRPAEILRYFRDYTLQGYEGRDHIWHGLTVCNQQEADEKIPIFLKVPGKKFLSIEPMLEPIDLYLTVQQGDESGDGAVYHNVLSGERWMRDGFEKELDDGVHVDAVVLGCETGAEARPMKLEWASKISDQCKAANVPLFIKALTINGKPNHNINEFPEDLRIRELAW